MRRALLTLLCAVTLSVPAFAQDDEGTPPPPVPPGAPMNVRPEGTTLGLGAGWVFPQSLLEPNTVGVRVRMGNLAIEPSVRVGGNGGTTGNKTSFTAPMTASESQTVDKDMGTNVTASANVRIPLASKGPVDLIAIGGASLSFSGSTENQDVTQDNRTDTTYTNSMSASVRYGLGIEWFIGHGLSVNADATNSLVSWTETNRRRTVVVTDPTTMETATTVTNTNGSDLSGALIWMPTLRLTLFLYF